MTNIYEEFKTKLLKEMEESKDKQILRAKILSPEYLFDIDLENDTLYRSLLNEFRYLTLRHTEILVQRLADKYGYETTPKNELHGSFDVGMNINGEFVYIVFKNSPWSYDSASRSRFIQKVQSCGHTVYQVFLLKDSYYSRRTVNSFCERIRQTADCENLKIMLFEDLICDVFGENELKEFREAMADFREEMHEAIGYNITELFNEQNLRKFRAETENELKLMDYDAVKLKQKNEITAKNPYYRELYDNNYEIIKNNYINGKMYRLLLGNGDFALSFIQSEWCFKKHNFKNYYDKTGIVSGYLKSIEQLLWDIIKIVGKNRPIRSNSRTNEKTVKITPENIDLVDTALGSLEYFITSYSNGDLLLGSLAISEKYKSVQHYLKAQIKDWREKHRNGYFHKHNLENAGKAADIREQTLFLYMLILGSVKLDEKSIVLLK